MRVITGREHARQRIELDILGERPVLFCVQRPQAALAQVWLEHTGGAWHSGAQRGPLRGDNSATPRSWGLYLSFTSRDHNGRPKLAELVFYWDDNNRFKPMTTFARQDIPNLTTQHPYLRTKGAHASACNTVEQAQCARSEHHHAATK